MSLKIMWLGQAGFILDDGTTSIAIDPFCGTAKDGTTRNYPPTVEGVHVDSVIVTHPHWDHYDLDTYRDYVIPKELIAPPSCTYRFAKSDLADKITATTIMRGETVERGAFKITAVMADHDGDSMGVVIEHEGKRIYHTGDTIFSPILLMMNLNTAPDVLFVPINGKGMCMSMGEAVLYTRIIQAKVAVPMHYDMISNNSEDPALFVSMLGHFAPDAKGFIMERGVYTDLSEILGE